MSICPDKMDDLAQHDGLSTLFYEGSGSVLTPLEQLLQVRIQQMNVLREKLGQG